MSQSETTWDAVPEQTSAEQAAAEQKAAEEKALPTTHLVVRVGWFFALGLMVLFAYNGYQMFEAANSAPQQAAAAAWACFQIIIPYVLARGLQEMLTA